MTLSLPLLACLALALGVAPWRAEVSPKVADAVAAAVVLPSARAEVVEVSAPASPSCAGARPEAPTPVTASGRVAIHFLGPGCDAWSWATVRLFAPALVLTRAVRAGEPLAPFTRLREVEVLPGHRPLAALPEAASASVAAAAGATLEVGQLRVGPAPGEPLTVLVRLGSVMVEQPGRALACVHGRACAVLPSGKRVEGPVVAGKLLVELP